jgi:hypothetical protein
MKLLPYRAIIARFAARADLIYPNYETPKLEKR